MNEAGLVAFFEYLVGLGDAALQMNLKIARKFRSEGISTLMDLEGRAFAEHRLNRKMAAMFGDTRVTNR